MWRAWSAEMPAVIGLVRCKKTLKRQEKNELLARQEKETCRDGRDDIKGAWRNLGGFRSGRLVSPIPGRGGWRPSHLVDAILTDFRGRVVSFKTWQRSYRVLQATLVAMMLPFLQPPNPREPYYLAASCLPIMKSFAAKALHPRRHSVQEKNSVRYSEPARSRNEVRFSWDETNPNIVIAADSIDFDPLIFDEFKEEGFDTAFLPHTDSPKRFDSQLQGLQDSMELGNRYAIVAYGEAASLVLEACVKPMPRLCAVVAYYPTHIPTFESRSISSLSLKIHLAGPQAHLSKERCYVYAHSKVGFAQHDLPQYDPVTARLAWSRTVSCLRQGFEMTPDIEPTWERHLLMKYASKDLEGTLDSYADGAHINYVPTRAGGIGHDALRRFYEEEFIPRNPPSLKIRLISRTKGSDHLVDEMYLSFKHTQEIPWILPGIPPTNLAVEVAIVSVHVFVAEGEALAATLDILS
ncbi:dienelactone hydrolase [Nannizzia gypsea CBS 118893]|uniref:Dienelactone hydrolase n=1 Tax=Arthroderma gypseum (strain ATCC MYA-4604 / CBS 118893) TaxID=535722 RepID=E4UP62_ARTGP|nr:dienelactone hydrolase [Nannizzia gypsea CBS 118893]EFQ99004.1 dienelactone hydrolase [Nannizzia gypsea CBS 118893]